MKIMNSRRRLFGGMAALSAAVTLAACSSPGAAPLASTGPVDAAEVVALSGADADHLGGGLTIPVGINVAMTGGGSIYGPLQVAGANLAAAQILAAGGPKFEFSIKDHKSGDAQAGVQTTRELGQEGVHLALYSYVGALGSAFDGLEQYKIVTLDPGGGTQKFGQNKPYFYGTRTFTPNDALAGIAKYAAERVPDATEAGFVLEDSGADNVADVVTAAKASFSAVGIELSDPQLVPIGGADFSAAVSKILAEDPPVVFISIHGTDTGLFLKQYRAAGGTAPVIGADWIADIPELAGTAADGYAFGTDYFSATDPANNPWAQFFVETWREAYPELGDPDLNGANFYEATFALWALVQRVLAEGGDVNNPDHLIAALEAEPTFSSVYGASASEPHGTFSIDLDTHSVSGREQYIYEYDGGDLVQRASFDSTGDDFQLTE